MNISSYLLTINAVFNELLSLAFRLSLSQPTQLCRSRFIHVVFPVVKILFGQIFKWSAQEIVSHWWVTIYKLSQLLSIRLLLPIFSTLCLFFPLVFSSFICAPLSSSTPKPLLPFPSPDPLHPLFSSWRLRWSGSRGSGGHFGLCTIMPEQGEESGERSARLMELNGRQEREGNKEERRRDGMRRVGVVRVWQDV